MVVYEVLYIAGGKYVKGMYNWGKGGGDGC
jgi:hypothetical protein